jgi:hypothetical protein
MVPEFSLPRISPKMFPYIPTLVFFARMAAKIFLFKKQFFQTYADIQPYDEISLLISR